MFRTAVIYSLLLATAAGPGLCYCASGRMTDLCNLLASTLGAEGGERRGCCGCAGGHGQKHSPERGESPNAPRECPCRATTPALPVLAERPPELRLQDGEFPQGSDSAAHHALGHGLDPASAGLGERTRALRPGRPRDLLAVLQTLRC